MGRSPCCDERGLKKGPWTTEEDEKLVDHIQNHGHGSWRALPKLAGLNRCGKSCRLRWTNYLRPDIKRGKFTPEEEQTILNLHSVLGNKWSTIATHLPGRTDNEIKNFWNTHLKKKLIHMGFDPMTHRPPTDIFSSLPHLIALASLKDLVDQHSWENQAVRLQTEAAQVANNLQYLQYLLQPPVSSLSAFSSNTLSSTPTNMDTFNLLNSPPFSGSSNPIETSILSSLERNSNVNIHQSVHDSIPFAHLPELQSPCSFQGSVNKEMLQVSDFNGENSENFLGLLSSLSPSPTLPVASVTNTGGDACSSSSFDGATTSIWPELFLDDPFFHEIIQ